MCRRRGCARWPRRSPTRISKAAGCCTDIAAAGLDGPFTVPLAAFKFAHGGPSIETRRRRWAPIPMRCSRELGYPADEIAALRAGAGDLIRGRATLGNKG